MTTLRWITAVLTAAVLATLAAAWAVPPVLDWNRYRDVIGVLASGTLGRPVRIDGPVTLRLLPQPVLTARRVVLAEDAQGVTATAAELRLRVALWPLLSGLVDAQDLVIFGLDARLPWPLGQATSALRAPAWLSALSARIEDGRLTIGEAVVAGIDATLSTREDTGSWNAAGTGTLSGRKWHFTARLTRPGNDGVAGIDLTLDGQGPIAGTGLALAGQIAAEGGMAGQASLRGPDLSLLLPAPAVPFRAEGRFRMAGGLAFADELAGEIAGAPARGALSLRLEPAPRLDLALTASRLDLDAWLPPLLRSAGLATGISTGVDLSAEAATLAGGTLRSLRAGIDIGGGKLQLREVRAILPGDATLVLAGQVLPADAAAARSPIFDGIASLSTANLRTTLAWAEAAGIGRVGALPAGVLRSAELRAHVVAGAEQIAVDRLEGTLDGDSLGGAATLRRGQRPILRARLTSDRIDLSRWLPATAGPGSLAALAAQFGGIEADLRLDAEAALLPGWQIAPLTLDLAIEPTRAILRRLEVQTTGLTALTTGTLTEGGRIADGRLDLRAPDAARLAALLPQLPALAFPLWRGAASLQLQASGTAEAMALRLVGELADLRVEAQPQADLTTGRWSGPLLLRHPGAPRFAELMGLNGTAAWLGDGSLSLIAQLAATPARIAAENLEISAGSLRASGALALERGDAPLLSGRIVAEALPLPLPYPRSPDPLPLALLQDWRAQLRVEAGEVLLGATPVMRRTRATVSLAGGLLRLDDLTATIEGGALTGRLSFDAAATPPALALDLALAGATLTGPLLDQPLDITAGGLDASATLTATGHAPAALLASLSGNLRLRVQAGRLQGIDLPRAGPDLLEADTRAALEGGDMQFDSLDLEARLTAGILTPGANARLTAPSGTIDITGTADLQAATSNLHLTIRPNVPDTPTLGLRLDGKLDTPRRTPELADLTRWRAARGL